MADLAQDVSRHATVLHRATHGRDVQPYITLKVGSSPTRMNQSHGLEILSVRPVSDGTKRKEERIAALAATFDDAPLVCYPTAMA